MIAALITNYGSMAGPPPPTFPPVANFDVSNLNPFVGDTIFFTDTTTNDPTGWNWYIDGSLFSTLQNPSYYCSSAGFPTFSLTASNSFGSSSHGQGVNIQNPFP